MQPVCTKAERLRSSFRATLRRDSLDSRSRSGRRGGTDATCPGPVVLPPTTDQEHNYSMSPFEPVRCDGNRYVLLPGMFYHLTTLDDPLLWNARLGEGLWQSVSALATIRGLECAATGYFLHSMHDPKERLWEAIREREFPTLPSRMNAFFLFDNPGTACRARQLWFRTGTGLFWRCEL